MGRKRGPFGILKIIFPNEPVLQRQRHVSRAVGTFSRRSWWAAAVTQMAAAVPAVIAYPAMLSGIAENAT